MVSYGLHHLKRSINHGLSTASGGHRSARNPIVLKLLVNSLMGLISSHPPQSCGPLAIALSGEACAGGGDEVQYEPAAPTVYGRLPRPEHGRAVRQGSGDGVPRGLGRRARKVFHPFQRLDGPRPPAFPSAMALARNPAPARARLHDKDEDD